MTKEDMQSLADELDNIELEQQTIAARNTVIIARNFLLAEMEEQSKE